MTLADFLKPLGMDERRALAQAAGTSYLHLRNVAFSGKSCGIALAVGLEQASRGCLKRWDLRPEDWHRIWPELIGAEGSPPIPAEEVRDAA